MIGWILNLFGLNKDSKEKTVSFLLGSGFSKADGLPLVGEINERMRKIDEKEIVIHSDGTAFFLRDEVNDDWERREERLFVQEFLKFYCEEIIEGEQSFHYEDFYDYFSEYLRSGYDDEDHPVSIFCDSFRQSHCTEDSISDNINLVSQFRDNFSQLLGSLLQRSKYYEDVAYLNYHPYNNFISFLNKLIETHEIKIHTLNHDLLFERIGSVLWQNFTDGYSEVGSPYYSYVRIDKNEHFPITKKYRVRLRFFQNRFDEKICLFKLHGSIDTYQFSIADQNKDLTRIKTDYRVEPRFVKEVQNIETGEHYYTRGLQKPFPDFLSGTTEKMKSYGNEYYKVILNHFVRNLSNSELLIVIGYGFADTGINQYLEDYFLKSGKKMIVINPSISNSELMSYNVEVLGKRIQNVTYDEFISILN